jgi:quercetin dioxygenase-like cupin family protein
MKNLAVLCLLALPTAAVAQTSQTAPASITVVTAAQVQALSAKAAAGQGSQPNVHETIIAAPGYTLNLEHRIARAPASVHPTEAEWMIVLDGAGTFTTGGKVTPAPGGDTIEGGQARHIVKGDMMLVPENVPHMLAPDSGAVLVLATLHIPHAGTAAAARQPKLFSAAADLPAMLERTKAALPANPRSVGVEPLLSLAPIQVSLEYRAPKGIASIHKTGGEFLYVIAGEGHVAVGGTLVNARDTGTNIEGDGLEGATDHLVKTGDFIFVPMGTRHLVISGSGPFAQAVLHVTNAN